MLAVSTVLDWLDFLIIGVIVVVALFLVKRWP